MLPERYNIRVYGLCLDDNERILVTDERRGTVIMTKFPGGGHHLGEGLADTVHREFMEETGLEVDVLGLFYINDFLQISAFNPKDQLLSIYYLVRTCNDTPIAVTEVVHDFDEGDDNCQTFRWVPLSEILEDHFTFPIDKIVAQKIKENHAYLKTLARQPMKDEL